jgi:hypothetical protein
LRSVKCSSPSVLTHRASGATDSVRRITWRAAKQWDAYLRSAERSQVGAYPMGSRLPPHAAGRGSRAPRGRARPQALPPEPPRPAPAADQHPACTQAPCVGPTRFPDSTNDHHEQLVRADQASVAHAATAAPIRSRPRPWATFGVAVMPRPSSHRASAGTGTFQYAVQYDHRTRVDQPVYRQRDQAGRPARLTMCSHGIKGVLIRRDRSNRSDTDDSPRSRPPDDPSAAITRHHQRQKTWSEQLSHHAQLVGLGPRTLSHTYDLCLFVPRYALYK